MISARELDTGQWYGFRPHGEVESRTSTAMKEEPDTLAALPPPLRQRRRSNPIPLWELVANFARRGASDDDPEGTGRLHVLAKAAVGLPAETDFAAEAKAWARKRSERQVRSREIDRLLSDSGGALSFEQGEHHLPHEAADREQLRGLLMEGVSSPATEPIDDRYFESLGDRIQNDQKTSADEEAPPRKHHPDSHELDDWQLYGPKSGTIFHLVSRLAYEHDMRVADIEKLIEEALQNKLRR